MKHFDLSFIERGKLDVLTFGSRIRLHLYFFSAALRIILLRCCCIEMLFSSMKRDSFVR